jgi:hypothetical protein
MDMSRSIDRKVKSRRRGFRSPKLSRSDPGQWVSLSLYILVHGSEDTKSAMAVVNLELFANPAR